MGSARPGGTAWRVEALTSLPAPREWAPTSERKPTLSVLVLAPAPHRRTAGPPLCAEAELPSEKRSGIQVEARGGRKLRGPWPSASHSPLVFLRWPLTPRSSKAGSTRSCSGSSLSLCSLLSLLSLPPEMPLCPDHGIKRPEKAPRTRRWPCCRPAAVPPHLATKGDCAQHCAQQCADDCAVR